MGDDIKKQLRRKAIQILVQHTFKVPSSSHDELRLAWHKAKVVQNPMKIKLISLVTRQAYYHIMTVLQSFINFTIVWHKDTVVWYPVRIKLTKLAN